ncbi:MAG: protoglobin domain-containing protein [Telluria sp.]
MLNPTQDRKLHGQQLMLSYEEIQKRKAFLEFSAEDEKALVGINDLADRYANVVIEDFYKHLMSFEETRGFFKDPKVLQRVKNSQKEYFLRLTKGNYDQQYIANRLKIGAVHERIDLPIQSYLGMYNFYLRAVAQRLFDAFRSEPDHAFKVFGSLMKLTFLDIGLAIDTYIDSRERTIRDQQEAIRELSTPVLQFRPGLLILPIVGLIDSQRAQQLTEQLLHSIRANRTKVIVIDITGVPSVDSRVANHLVQTVEAARLMGAAAIITGVAPEIAQTMVTIGIDLGRVRTVGDLQSGVEQAERLLGYRVVQSDDVPDPNEQA